MKFTNTRTLLSVFLMGSMIWFSSCKDEEDADPMPDTTSELNLNITGLEDLGSDAIYEGWIIVDGKAITTGTFSVDADGKMSTNSFTLEKADLDAASTFVLTIEPQPDTDPAPSSVHILAGDFSGVNATLAIDHSAALGTDFSSAMGTYILATPTDDDEMNEASGIWFLDNSSGAPAVGLDLPTLPAGWAYEGWAVIDGKPVSTGTFTMVDKADDAAPYSGTKGGPPFPGEDFLNNAPMGLTFPTMLQGGMAVISVEPVPDNSTAPFTLKPLAGMIDASAEVHKALQMPQNLNFPTGTAMR